MLSLVTALRGPAQSRERNDDDVFDRFSHRYTTSVFILFAIFMGMSQFVGTQISCWFPAHFTGSHTEYGHSYCYVKNTYYLPFEDYIPHEGEHHLRHMITYYQWVPLIYLTQALLFFLPCLVWRSFNLRSGIDVDEIVKAATKFHTIAHDSKEKDSKLNAVVEQMNRYLDCRPFYNKSTNMSVTWIFKKVLFRFSSREKGTYLILLYIIVKLFYIANVLGQLFLLDLFMNHSFASYGIDVLSNLISNKPWVALERFPRVTMCDFKVRRMGDNIQRYTVQCALPHNIFYEKIFLFLWFWMVIVAIASVYGMVRWVFKFLNKGSHHRYIRKHLISGQALDVNPPYIHKQKCIKFCDKFLRADGVFVLQLIDCNTDIITTNEIICKMFEVYCKRFDDGTQINPTTDEETNV